MKIYSTHNLAMMGSYKYTPSVCTNEKQTRKEITMKITVTTKKEIVAKTYDTMLTMINECKPLDQDIISDIRHGYSTSSHKCGPAYEMTYTVDDTTATFDLAVEDDAILLFLSTAAKLSKVLSPLYSMGVGIYKMMVNMTDQIKGVFKDTRAEFNDKFGKEATYNVARIKSADLGIDTGVVVEDDGFGHEAIVYTRHNTHDTYGHDIEMKLYKSTKGVIHGVKTYDEAVRICNVLIESDEAEQKVPSGA